jgi:hypothetical protein
MKRKQLITMISIALLPLAAGAATFIIPAAGTGPGPTAVTGRAI